MYKSTVAALGVVGTASAQEPVLNFGFTSQSIVGSVITSVSSASRCHCACSGSGTADIAGSTTTISEILTNFTDGGAVLDATETRSAFTPASASKSSTDRTIKASSPSRATGVTRAETGGSLTSISSKAAPPMTTQALWHIGGAAAAFAYYAAMP
ncbi:hypothetical protein BGZ57DRAFT_854834 [Hyaloscypha finlandica]|nr:hypothetical protein BGZ57DRAFT_854834 [Hyaloscypha finlandica]